ncbi:capsular polysaccharide export protein, LipB/KpsS family [Halomonas salipaludis]|uniref:capsular polysaccharide export protein, LipB/KpsS family n=1 Tax=Halomonas salipaludis TaxID=2032625 RepID=UPI001140D395|nr:hypothetical protein [Halomonas salipaludis]
MATILAFGFPFTPKNKSRFTGLGTGPIVLKSFQEKLNSKVMLVSPAARYYAKDDNIMPQEHRLVIRGTSQSSAPLDQPKWEKLLKLEATIMEMEGRTHIRQEISTPSINVYDNRRNSVRNKIAYWNEFVNKRKLVAYVNSNVPHLVDDLICYELCKIYNIPAAFPYRLPIVPGVSARLYIPYSLYEHGKVYDRDGSVISCDSISDDEARAPLPDDLRLIYDEVVVAGKSLSEASKEVLERSEVVLPKQFSRKINDDGVIDWKKKIKHVLKGEWITLSSKVELYKIERENNKIYKELAEKKLPARPFVYFPLHMQPEASSCPLGGMYSDQLRAIRVLSEALPSGWTLMVKEHPVQDLTRRPLGWYREILKNQNVELASLDLSSADLQRECRAVATLTGTAAWEAWLWRKPAIVMGHILFQEAPGIYKVRSLKDAKIALRKIQEGVLHTQDDIRLFLGKLAKLSFTGHLDAYISPCMSEDFDAAANERDIGIRLAMAIIAQQKDTDRAIIKKPFPDVSLQQEAL